MKSIRLSLIVYSLLLLGAALLAMSLFVFEITSRALQEKQETNRQLLLAQAEERRKEEVARLDNELLARGRAIGNMAQSQFEASRLFGLQFLPLGSLTALPGPNGHLAALACFDEFRGTPLSGEIAGLVATQIQLIDMLPRSEDRAGDFFQINRPLGRSLRSRSLGGRSLPFDAERFAKMQMVAWDFDDIDLNGQHLRRVLLKMPILHSLFIPGPWMPRSGDRPRREGRGERASPPSSPPPPPPSMAHVTPPFYIQYATDRAELDATLAELEANTADQVRQSDDAARQTLSSLRSKLAWISLGVFAAMCIGVSLLVRHGLLPLRRLGEAVGRVSPSDFRLQFNGPGPPSELAPIVERLEHTLAMLQRAFDREKQASADISHELRTPLAGLMTTLDVALRKTRTPAEYRESLNDCRDIARQMTQMVERLLALTWLDARSDRVRREPVDAGELADQCAAVIRPLAKAHGLTLNVHKDAPVPISTDPDKLREVLSNLMHNAVEYNRPDGSIDLSVHSDEKGLDFEVRDTGIGIPLEDRERIFERFFRADESRQATGLHAGLGLAIVRGCVELMGGTITVESEVGRGSTFRVHIPAART